jgi:ABC-type antimicrobial peptide transport system permease subunit
MCYLDNEVTDAKDLMQAKIADEGMRSTPVLVRRIQVNLPDGTNTLMTIIVPDDPSTFSELYQLNSMDGNTASLDQDGIWLVSSFEKVDHYTKGAPMVLAEGSGSVREIPIAGFYEFYSIRREAVMSKESYEKYFGAKPKPNVLLVDTAGKEVPDLQKEFKGSKGYLAFANDHKAAVYAFDVLAQVLSAVVVIYIFLSALMAIMVLLNLDVMYVNEKKRELIVLRINGFTVRECVTYVSWDLVVTTAFGILLGLVGGHFAGLHALPVTEGPYMQFVHEPDLRTYVYSALVTAGFSALISSAALRRVKYLKLSDVL